MKKYDAIIIGAGFGGMYMLVKLRQLGLRTIVLEAGEDVGGTWYWNRYPGARCDVESLEYSYSFNEELQQEWDWSERYAAQPEILKYAQHVADRFDLRKDILFNSRVTQAQRDAEQNSWTVKTSENASYEAAFLITALGCLSLPNKPSFPGLEQFTGEVYHTGEWPKNPVNFAGKQVGIIGTGSSAIQLIPIIAQEAKRLYVFQRTPNYSVPARNRKLDPEAVSHYKARYSHYRKIARRAAIGIASHPMPIKSALEVDAVERELTYSHAWNLGSTAFTRVYADLTKNKQANETAAEFVREQIRQTVSDPDIVEKLLPDYPIGTKRLCLDSGYFETYRRPNVTLVDVRSAPIESLTTNGLSVKGTHYDLDAVIFATGFDAVTGPILAIDIRNEHGDLLRNKWADGPKSYLGLMTAGYKNLFMITGPGSPSILVNVFVAIEQHVEWIHDCIAHMKSNHLSIIEAEPSAEESWREEVEEVANRTLLASANSWYVGANIKGKPKVFLPYAGGMADYISICERVVADRYSGFRFL